MSFRVTVDVRQQRAFQHRRKQRFEVALRQIGIPVFARNDFALLGEAQEAVHRACGLRANRLVARPAAATDAAAATVEQTQTNTVLCKSFDERCLRTIERPVGREVAAVLVAVAVAEHDLLRVALRFEPTAIERMRKRSSHHFRRGFQVFNRLEQGRNRHRQVRHFAAAREANLFAQRRDFEQIRQRFAHRNNHARQRGGTKPRVHFCGLAENC